MDDWAAQYEDDPALRESKAQQEAAGIYEWRREGLDITKGNTQRFAEAHSSLREAVAEFYVLNGGMLALPSLAELVVAGRNTSCGSAVWMGLDGGICLASNAISLWLWSKREAWRWLRVCQWPHRAHRIAPAVGPQAMVTAQMVQVQTPKKRLRPLSAAPEQRQRQLEAWLTKNQDRLQQAEKLLSARWADATLFCEQMPLCEKVLQTMRRVLGGDAAESKSLLVLGEPGSGKTQAVDWCLQKLREENDSIITLRARGDAYASNIECLRHLAQQIAAQLMTTLQNGSFEGSMEWFRCILKESFSRESAVVIVLDRFEHFCGLARQTLLYNLFNLAQDLSVRLCIVGVSEKFDVTCQLEKRILSRFSMEYVFAFLPRDAQEVLRLLECKLHLPEQTDDSFAPEFNQRVSEALQARLPEWVEHIELGRKPTWFLWQCLPVVGFLRNSLSRPKREPGEEAKRRRLFLRGLAECEHLLLLALFRQRKKTRSLSTVLHELLRLADGNGTLAGHSEETLSAAFFRLVSYKLVRFTSASGVSNDVAKRYHPCDSEVDTEYKTWVEDLHKSESAMLQNPLRELPESVQHWVRQT